MKDQRELPIVVIADDNPGDRKLSVTALRKSRLGNPIQEIEDGEDLPDYLLNKGKHAEQPRPKGPAVILLDINMSKKNGL